MEITIDIKKKHIYLGSFVLMILLIVGVKAFDSRQPWHPISQIVDDSGQQISNSNGDISPTIVYALNSVHVNNTGYSNNSYGVGDTNERYKLFWEGTFNITHPSERKNNIRLCYYTTPREQEVYRGTTSKVCPSQSANIDYSSFDANCKDYICNKICQKAIACYGNLVPEHNEYGYDVSNTQVNYNSGVCLPTQCKDDNSNYYGDAYYCGCNCSLNSPTNYNQVYEGSVLKTNKFCLVFQKV
jgi:hypothetical protein